MLAFELTSEEIIWPASNKLYHITLQFWQTPFFESKLVRIDIIDSGTKTLLHAVFQFSIFIFNANIIQLHQKE